MSTSGRRAFHLRSTGAMIGLTTLLAIPLSAQQTAGSNTAQIQTDAQKQLHGKQFHDVQVQVADGVVTLTGQVDRLSDKIDAEKRIAKMHEAASISNQIKVNVPGGITDAQIFQKAAKQLAYVGQEYDRLAFNSLLLQVRDGVATVGGEVVDPVDKDSALNIVENTPGVRGIVDHVQVAPVSPMDWGIRRAMYQAVYGGALTTKYAINPERPIRIVVVNGHVILTGVVDSQADRDYIGVHANGVPGVFSVKNDIQVAGQNPEH